MPSRNWKARASGSSAWTSPMRRGGRRAAPGAGAGGGGGTRGGAAGRGGGREGEGGGMGFQRLDITDEAARAQASAGFERVEVLVNAAGIIAHGGAEFCIGGFRKVLEVNLNGTH